MLSRVADSIYWMSRYIERAENLARLLDVVTQFLLDARLPSDRNRDAAWDAVLKVIGLSESYRQMADPDRTLGPLDFLVLDHSNPDSIRQCVVQARANGLMARDRISDEMWRELNTIYLHLEGPHAPRNIWQLEDGTFYERLVQFSLHFQGITDATLNHGEGWMFFQLGKYIERADKTTRFLDLAESLHQVLGVSPWGVTLRACSARTAYLDSYRATPTPDGIVNLLLFSREFPRSVRFCLHSLYQFLQNLSGSSSLNAYNNEAERLAGETLANLDFNGPQTLQEQGLHHYIDGLQLTLNELGQRIFETYVLHPSEIKLAAPIPSHAWTQIIQFQQQQQQQQQQ